MPIIIHASQRCSHAGRDVDAQKQAKVSPTSASPPSAKGLLESLQPNEAQNHVAVLFLSCSKILLVTFCANVTYLVMLPCFKPAFDLLHPKSDLLDSATQWSGLIPAHRPHLSLCSIADFLAADVQWELPTPLSPRPSSRLQVCPSTPLRPRLTMKTRKKRDQWYEGYKLTSLI